MSKEEIISSLSESKGLLPDNYELFVNPDSQGVGVVVLEKTDEVLNRLSVWITNDGKYSTFVPSINYTVIEEIIQPIFESSNLGTGKYVESEYSTIYMKDVEPELYKKSVDSITSGEIERKEDIDLFFEQLVDYLNKVASPFYEKWRSLNTLNEFITQTPQTELHKYFGMGGVFKKAVLYKLTANPKFEEYFDLIYSGYKNKYITNKDISAEAKFKVVEKLKEIIPNINP